MASYRLPQHLTLWRAVPLSMLGMSSSGFIPRWQSCPASRSGVTAVPLCPRHSAEQPSRMEMPLPVGSCVSHVYFWKSLNFTVKDVPELVRKSSGGTEHLSACFLTHWSDRVNKTYFDSHSLNLSGKSLVCFSYLMPSNYFCSLETPTVC